MTDFNALKKQYEDLKELCIKGVSFYEDKDELIEDFPNQIMMLILRVWGAQPGYHEDYKRALEVVAGEIEMSEATFDDLVKSVAEVPLLPAMKQFIHMVITEGAIDKPFCKSFIDLLVEFLTDMAFINGDCVPEEANQIEQIRMVHMDFYNEFNLTRRRVKTGAVPAGTFKYDRYGLATEWTLNKDGVVSFNSSAEPQSEDKVALISEAAPEKKKYIVKSKLPDSLFRVDMRAAEVFGLTDIKVHGWWHNDQLIIVGQLYAEKGLKDEFSLIATIIDKDGDIVEQRSNEGYGGGSISTSMVRKNAFFHGYPFRFYSLAPVSKTSDISEIRITFDS